MSGPDLLGDNPVSESEEILPNQNFLRYSAASDAASECLESTLARQGQVEKVRETRPFIRAKLNHKSVDEDDDNKEDAPKNSIFGGNNIL